MDIIAICIAGCEEECAMELSSFGMQVLEGAAQSGFVFAHTPPDVLAHAAIYALTPRYLLIRLYDYDGTLTSRTDLDVSGDTFRVRTIFGSRSEEPLIADMLAPTGMRADLVSPSLPLGYVRSYNPDVVHIGAFLSDFDFSKRDYKVYMVPRSMNAALAQSMLWYGDLGKEEVFLDPFAGDGILPIEYHFFSSGKSAREFQKERIRFDIIKRFGELSDVGEIEQGNATIYCVDPQNSALVRAKQNARLAHADMVFSRFSLEWIDTRFEDVSAIVTQLPPRIDKDLFFERMHTILDEDGKLVVLSSERLEDPRFEIIKSKPIVRGESYHVLSVMVPR